MRTLSSFILVLFFASLLAGCLVRTRGHHHHNKHRHSNARRDCPPAYHWNGNKCVHNGRGHAKGHRR